MRRRTFLLAASALAWRAQLRTFADRLSSVEGEELWQLVRGAFLVPRDRIYLNVGTLGVQPRVVVDAVLEHTRRVAMSYPPGVQWDTLKQHVAELLNGDAAGFVFPRNTTEAMNFVANGLELGAGDEVLTTSHEHIGGLCCWQLIAARRGVTLRQLELPAPATSAGQLVDLFRRALSPRTRVVSVSHVTFTNGTVMPVRDIAALCRDRGVICVVDGAHPPGMLRVDLRAIDADFYASSPHKWLCAPQGTGLLYLREQWRTRLWPTLASGDWDRLELGAHRFNHLGTFDESRLAALDAAILFQQTIGIGRIEARIRELRRRLIDALAAIPRVRIMSPLDDTLGAGLVSFTVGGIDSLVLQQRLADAANVRTRVIGEYGYGWMRLSPHIYTAPSELDRVAELIAAETKAR
jgi:isopenicillin-N epimerase